MSKTSARSQRKKGGGHDSRRPRSNDGAIYLGLIIIGLFIVALAFLLGESKREVWGPVCLGYVAALAWLTNLYAISVYRGKSLANWQFALARLPLRLAGFGTKNGKPVEAAHNVERAKMAIMIGIAASIVILVGLSFLVIPGMTAP